MDFVEFRRLYANRLRAYVRRYRRRIGAPVEFTEDLEQTAWLSVHRVLPSWKADGGLSAFNWCAGPILAEMYREWRRAQGYKPFGAEAMARRDCALGPNDGVDDSFATIERICDMRRAFAEFPRPSHLVRFVMVALSPSSAAELGRNIGLTRQAVSTSVRATRLKLKAAMD